jgi:hypothetical protein
MNVERRTHLISLVLACLLVITFTALPVLAQENIWDKTKQGVKKGPEEVGEGAKKGAEVVGKGVKKGAHETKEGAEAVGRGTKRAVTGDEHNEAVEREKGTEFRTQQPAMRPYEARPSQTGKHHMGASTREKGLPRTAGEFPLLALSGALALAGAALSRLVRRVKSH